MAAVRPLANGPLMAHPAGRRHIDIMAELETHWGQHDGLPLGLRHRLHACLVHIGLDAMAYIAYRGRCDDLVRIASQVSQLI
jgi:hygromycin-B 4-O-kinase